jgi:hypothetical protein
VRRAARSHRRLGAGTRRRTAPARRRALTLWGEIREPAAPMPRTTWLRTVPPFLLGAALATFAAAQTPQVTFAGETMRLRSATVVPAGGASTFNVTLTMENDNASGSLPTSYRRWWHCQVGNLAAAGVTLVVTVNNSGYQDTILPVWAQSTDGGATFGAYTRLPTSAVPTQPTSTSHRFTIATPPGVTTIRLAKYFPYGVARKDAWLASLAGHPHVRSIAAIGNSQQGRPLHKVQLTDASRPDAGKKRVWIHSGIHPAETTSYFTVEGLIDWLGSGDPFAEVLLDHTILDIVPMANPDGVALGNYRVNANSVNLEDEWAAPYASTQPEIVALRTAIEGFMGTPAAPGSNPIEVLLNLHSSHNVTKPFHFQHAANANWTPGATGVIPVVNAIEGQWIVRFKARSPFVDQGTTQSSSAGFPSRPFVESMLHDRWSAVSAWTGAPAFRQPVMGITFEGTYGFGPAAGQWNTEADYRLTGAQMGRALCDHFGLQLTASAVAHGVPCQAVVLQAALAPVAGGHLATLSFAGAPANGLGVATFGFAQSALPMPAPWAGCLLRNSLDANTIVFGNAFGLGGYQLVLPTWPGLAVHSQILTLDLGAPVPVGDTSNGIELRNDF